jgi:hypothetical protein
VVPVTVMSAQAMGAIMSGDMLISARLAQNAA